MIKNLINYTTILLFIIVVASCKEKEKKSFKKQTFFMPYLHTNVEITDIDSLVLVKYQNRKIIDSSKVCIKNKYPDEGSATKWRFMLCDSFQAGYDYKLIFTLNKKQHSYLFTNIVYDTIQAYGGFRHDTKSYQLNGTKYFGTDCNYTLPDH